MQQYAEGKEITKSIFPHQIAFNLFSHNTKVAENGYNEEENKVIEETRKMFHMPELAIVPTCIRVPVLRAHSEAITLDLEQPLSPAEAREILAKAPGVKLVDDRAANHFPMPLEASGDLDVHVGRIRSDLSNPNGLVLFVAGDQLLKGAAWNAVQIAEELAKPGPRPGGGVGNIAGGVPLAISSSSPSPRSGSGRRSWPAPCRAPRRSPPRCRRARRRRRSPRRSW